MIKKNIAHILNKVKLKVKFFVFILILQFIAVVENYNIFVISQRSKVESQK